MIFLIEVIFVISFASKWEVPIMGIISIQRITVQTAFDTVSATRFNVGVIETGTVGE